MDGLFRLLSSFPGYRPPTCQEVEFRIGSLPGRLVRYALCTVPHFVENGLVVLISRLRKPR